MSGWDTVAELTRRALSEYGPQGSWQLPPLSSKLLIPPISGLILPGLGGGAWGLVGAS